jgi:hypothetical protein
MKPMTTMEEMVGETLKRKFHQADSCSSIEDTGIAVSLASVAADYEDPTDEGSIL